MCLAHPALNAPAACVFSPARGVKSAWVGPTADAYAVLETWLRERPATPDPHMFLNHRGQPLTANGIQWLLHSYGKPAGLDLTPHPVAAYLCSAAYRSGHARDQSEQAPGA